MLTSGVGFINTGAIILADVKNALNNILLTPSYKWVARAVTDAGIDTIFIVSQENRCDIKVWSSLQQATENINKDTIIVLSGNRPLIDAVSIRNAIEMHKAHSNDITVISEESIGYCINAAAIGKKELKKEIFVSANENISLTSDTGADINRANGILRRLSLEKLTDNGIDIPCYDGIIITPDCRIGKGTKILPNTIICGNSVIGENCTLGPDSYIENARIGNSVIFNHSQIRNAEIKDNADIGPFVHIRPDSVIGNNVHLGNFVEVKNSVIDTDTKVSHLTYVGDSDVGKNVNFGCGVVTVNFNGKTKNRTIIKDGAFIGCNTNLVAPVTVGENSYTAAGSTITQDVPDNSLAIARERQTNKNGWVKEKQPYRKKV